MSANAAAPVRDVVFISKGTPNDDDFVLWLAPRLEAHGYKTFADILSLQPGDRWRREITSTLQTRAIKRRLARRYETNRRTPHAGLPCISSRACPGTRAEA